MGNVEVVTMKERTILTIIVVTAVLGGIIGCIAPYDDDDVFIREFFPNAIDWNATNTVEVAE